MSGQVKVDATQTVAAELVKEGQCGTVIGFTRTYNLYGKDLTYLIDTEVLGTPSFPVIWDPKQEKFRKLLYGEAGYLLVKLDQKRTFYLPC